MQGSTLLDSSFDLVAHVMRSSRCSLMLLDSSSDELRVGRATGLSAEIIARSRARLDQSIAGLVASRGQALLVRDMKSEPEMAARAVGGCKTDSMISVPVIVQGKVYGVLNVTDRVDGQRFNADDLATLTLLAAHLAMCIEYCLLQAEIRRLANLDGLTEVYNHRYFHERLDEELERSTRFDRPVSLLMIDVNGFKEFNDSYGHLAGDVVLKEIAVEVRRQVRHFDMVSRYGGDEFTVTLPESDAEQALQAAERIARAIAVREFPHVPIDKGEGLTASIGISTFPASAGYKRELIQQADRAMYSAKQREFPHILHWDEMQHMPSGSMQVAK